MAEVADIADQTEQMLDMAQLPATHPFLTEHTTSLAVILNHNRTQKSHLQEQNKFLAELDVQFTTQETTIATLISTAHNLEAKVTTNKTLDYRIKIL